MSRGSAVSILLQSPLRRVDFLLSVTYWDVDHVQNPKEMSDTSRKAARSFPVNRPGRRNDDYLEKVMVRITYVGSGVPRIDMRLFRRSVYGSLECPMRLTGFYAVPALLIAVSVAIRFGAKASTVTSRVMLITAVCSKVRGGGTSPTV